MEGGVNQTFAKLSSSSCSTYCQFLKTGQPPVWLDLALILSWTLFYLALMLLWTYLDLPLNFLCYLLLATCHGKGLNPSADTFCRKLKFPQLKTVRSQNVRSTKILCPCQKTCVQRNLCPSNGVSKKTLGINKGAVIWFLLLIISNSGPPKRLD